MTTKKKESTAEMWLKMATKVANGELNVINLFKDGCKVVDAVSDCPDDPDFVKMTLVQIKQTPGGVCIPVMVDFNGNLSEPSDKTGWKIAPKKSSSLSTHELAEDSSTPERINDKTTTPKRRPLTTDVYIPDDDEDELTYLHKIIGLKIKEKEDNKEQEVIKDGKKCKAGLNYCQFSFCDCNSNNCDKIFSPKDSHHYKYDYTKPWKRFVDTVDPIDGPRLKFKRAVLYLCSCHFPKGKKAQVPTLTDTDIKKLCLKQRKELTLVKSKLELIMTSLRKYFDEEQILKMLGIDHHGNSIDNQESDCPQDGILDYSETDDAEEGEDESRKEKKKRKPKRGCIAEYSNRALMKGMKLCSMMPSSKYEKTCKEILEYPMPSYRAVKRFAQEAVSDDVNDDSSTIGTHTLMNIPSNGTIKTRKPTMIKRKYREPKKSAICPLTGKEVILAQVDPEDLKRVANELLEALNERTVRCEEAEESSDCSKDPIVPKRRQRKKKKASKDKNDEDYDPSPKTTPRKRRKRKADGSPSKVDTINNHSLDNHAQPLIDFQFLINSINDNHHHHHPV